MKKIQSSDGKRFRSGVFAGFRRKLSPLWLLIVLAVALTSLEGTALGQNGCLAECQQDYSLCLQESHGDAAAEALCQDNYDACVEECLRQ